MQGAALDWAVAKCEGKNGVLHDDGITRCIVAAAPSGVYKGTYRPSTNWAQGGPIIEREKISLEYLFGAGDGGADVWVATRIEGSSISEEQGQTPLIAAMRCYVAACLGDTIDLPEELAR